jgi:hypothetical protein
MSDTDIEDRLASLETFTGRLVLAGDDSDGSGAWRNYLEQRLQQERKFSQEVVAIALAGMRDHIVDLCKTTIDAALSNTIRGTYDPKASYAANDLVACDGASFLAKCDSPGRCPGPNWQLIAQQGKRGVRGPPASADCLERLSAAGSSIAVITLSPRSTVMAASLGRRST